MQLPFRPEDLIDPYHGQHDLARQLVRAVGKPALRLQEDALRILRALRFAATLGFQLAEETAKAVQQQAQLLIKLARERIFTELAQLLAGPHLAGVLQDHFSVLAVAVPQLQPLCRNQQAGRTARAAVLALPARFDLRLAALLQAAAKETRSPATAYASRALADLRADRKLAKNIRLMLAAAEDLPDARAGSIKMWLKNISPQTARSALLLGQAQAAAGSAKSHVLADAGRLLEQILVKKQYYQLADLALGGHDLIQLGLVAGPAVGRLLDLLLDQVILGQVPNEKEQLLQLAATLIRTEQEKP